MNNVKHDPVFIFVCPHPLIVWHSGASDNGKDPLALLGDEDDMSPEDEAIGMVIPDGFRLERVETSCSRQFFSETWCVSETKHGVVWRPITRKTHERTKEVYDYRVHLEEDQSVRSMKLPLGAYSTETNAEVGAWVLLERNDKEKTGGTVGGGGRTVSWEIQKQAEKNWQSVAAGEY